MERDDLDNYLKEKFENLSPEFKDELYSSMQARRKKSAYRKFFWMILLIPAGIAWNFLPDSKHKNLMNQISLTNERNTISPQTHSVSENNNLNYTFSPVDSKHKHLVKPYSKNISERIDKSEFQNSDNPEINPGNLKITEIKFSKNKDNPGVAIVQGTYLAIESVQKPDTGALSSIIFTDSEVIQKTDSIQSSSLQDNPISVRSTQDNLRHFEIGISYSQYIINSLKSNNSSSQFKTNDTVQAWSDKAQQSFKLELDFRYHINRNWFAGFGLGYTCIDFGSVKSYSPGSVIAGVPNFHNQNDKLLYEFSMLFDEKYHYLSFPLYLGYHRASGKWGYEFHSGFLISHLWKTESLKITSLSGTEFTRINDARNIRFNRNIPTATAGINLTRSLTKGLGIKMGMESVLMLKSNFNSDLYPAHKPFLLSVTTGLFWRF